MKHIVLVTVEHKEPLPIRGELSLTEVLADRAYQWLHANGVSVEVTASMVTDVHVEDSRG